ncbi:MAG: hypothetical protein HY758_07365 [Nitrospirae bacterium]|nr:hypothetical protein [Nitrospirota bacterium]
MMNWTCPACGIKNDDDIQSCVCGHYGRETAPGYLNDTDLIDSIRKIKTLDKSIMLKTNRFFAEEVIKEIDSWMFAYSPSDKCIYLGTPALQSFRLKMTAEDLEQLLELLYKRNGCQKTVRKVQLSLEEVSDLIEQVDKKIEEKKAKVRVRLIEDEVKEIADLINLKLKA